MMSKCAADSSKKLQVSLGPKKHPWFGNIVKCFGSVLTLLGGPGVKKDEEVLEEIPFESIHELRYLGSGSQGTVFAGRLHGEMVAVKKVREKCETEDVKHLMKLNHENIVRFRGVCSSPPYCIVMDYCQYGSLFEFLHSGSTLSPAQLMNWAKDIALGVAYLHSHKIIHRDLKSPNVLIADNLTVKLSDFGNSRLWDDVSTVMSFSGTVAWMAPETIRHEPCSEKVDVWSFGVVLWEMMTREIPYKTMDTHAIMWGVGTDSLSLPIPTGCPNSIQVLMCQCWQRIAKNRPQLKTIAAHLEMATPDIVAVDGETFAARQKAWGAEVREGFKRIHARNNKSETSASSNEHQEAPKLRENLRQREAYEKQIVRANELYMEVCAVRLQLEQRERALAEREKQLKACRCGQRKNIKIQRQQSTTSSDGKPIGIKQPCKNRLESQVLVNYVDKDAGSTYTVAVNGCLCSDSIRNNNVVAEKENNVVAKKDTVVEKNGNVEMNLVPLLKPKTIVACNMIPDVAQV